MSENKLKIELSSIRMVNEIGVRSQIRKAEVGFLVTGWDRDASAEVPLVELVELVEMVDRRARQGHVRSQSVWAACCLHLGEQISATRQGSGDPARANP